MFSRENQLDRGGRRIIRRDSGSDRAGLGVGRDSGSGRVVRRTVGVGLPWVQFPPGNWVAPAGSYRSGGGGNEAVGAFEINAWLLAMRRAGRP
jgi:hypothetical protein